FPARLDDLADRGYIGGDQQGITCAEIEAAGSHHDSLAALQYQAGQRSGDGVIQPTRCWCANDGQAGNGTLRKPAGVAISVQIIADDLEQRGAHRGLLGLIRSMSFLLEK